MIPNDSELMVRAVRGDTEAFDVLMKRHQQMLMRWIWGMLGNEDEAADVAQDAFLQAYIHRDRFNPKMNFKTWLYTIARNRATSILRKRGRRAHLRGPLPGESAEDGQLDDWADIAVDDKPGPRDTAQAHEDAEWLRIALEKLDEKHRVVLQMKYFEGLKSREIADVLGLEVGTVWSRVHHGLKKLKAYAEEVSYHE